MTPPCRPMLSVIIVTHRSAATVGPCLRSLPWGSMPLEAIVVDNASDDGTRQAVDAFRSGRPGIRLRRLDNPSNAWFAAAVNRGLAECRGGFICLLGPDTRVCPGALETLVRFLKNNPDAGAAAPRLVGRDGRTQRSCRRFPTASDALLELSGFPRLFPRRFRPRWKMPEFTHDAPADVDQPEASCLVVRRGAFEQAGFMDERFPLFFNDVDWCRRIKAAGWRIVFRPEAAVLHEGGASVNRAGVLKYWKSHQGFYRYLAKTRPRARDRAGNLALGFLLAAGAAGRSALALMFSERSDRT